jgi:hypothetical protein
MTIIEFLEARIAEDEAVAREVETDFQFDPSQRLLSPLELYAPGYDTYPVISIDQTRVLAECAAKRAIVTLHRTVPVAPGRSDTTCSGCGDAFNERPCPTLAHLATVYADHPDYLPEWAI